VTSVGVAKDLSQFDTKTFLSTIDGSRKIADFAKKRVIFIQDALRGSLSAYVPQPQ